MTPSLLRSTGIRLALATGVALALTAAHLDAQEASSEPFPAALDVYLGVTGVAGVAAGQAGFAGSLRLARNLRIGGGAWSVLRRIDEGDALDGTGLELGLGYGGVFAEMGPAHLPLSARLLVGGGAATLKTAAVGTPFDTETFVVVEPALVGRIALPGPFAFGIVTGFRQVLGVEDFFPAGDHDLDGFRASVFLRVGR